MRHTWLLISRAESRRTDLLCRVLAQVVYYVHSCLHVAMHEKDSSVDFAIPTGNFGDIFAGIIAKKMLPAGTIRQLVLATNENDILTRFVNSGDYSLGEVKITSSPSMDIQAASNFERYLYYLMDSDAARTKELMEEFAQNGKIDLSGYQDQIRRILSILGCFGKIFLYKFKHDFDGLASRILKTVTESIRMLCI